MAGLHGTAGRIDQAGQLKLSPVVAEVGFVMGDESVAGTFIPAPWFDAPALQFENGKPNLKAIVLLADLLYWYSPAGIYDAATGLRTGWRQRFVGDKLQKNYDAWGRQFGFSRREAQLACHFLRDVGLITIELRNVTGAYGRQYNNVNFFEPVVRKLARLSDPPAFDATPFHTAADPLTHPDAHASSVEMPESAEGPDLERDSETNLPVAREENAQNFTISTGVDRPASSDPPRPESSAPQPPWVARKLLCDAVLQATNNCRRFEMGAISPGAMRELAALLDYLEACGRRPADVELYRRALPAFLNKTPEFTVAPTLRQMLNNFDRVLEYAARRAHRQTAASGPAHIAREYCPTAERCEGNLEAHLEIMESGREMAAAPRKSLQPSRSRW